MKKLLTFTFLIFSLSIFGQTKFNQKPVVQAAKAFLASLTADQKAKTNLKFSDPDRLEWSNSPMGEFNRKGLWLFAMTDEQKRLLHKFLQTSLSSQGYQKTINIIRADEVLKNILWKENDPLFGRYGNEKYWITIFNEPADDKIWGWQFEGHHVSINFTHSQKGVTCTPMFIGANPVEILTGPYAGNNFLVNEGKIANDLLNLMNTEQKKMAIVEENLPKDIDILTRTGKEPFVKKQVGLPYSKMTTTQKNLTIKIIQTWTENLAPELAEEKMTNLKARGLDKITFAWIGPSDTSKPHYFRLQQGNSFIIELAHREGNGNHYHSLYRELDEDFRDK